MQHQGTQVISFDLNGKTTEVTTILDTPFLWVVRDQLKLKGSKFGCGGGN
jgi:isoquinoline 1-oxidoreductase alpha subunit